MREKVRTNGNGGRREREWRKEREREEDEESLVDSVDRNEGEKIVRRRERERMRNGGVEDERVREKRREYYERD